MLVGTHRWVMVLEGEIPPGVDEHAVRMDLTSVSIPVRMLGLIANTRLVMGTHEQIEELMKDFPR